MLNVEIITLFPEYFDSPIRTSILGRAIKQEKVNVQLHQLREFTLDKHRRVDDRSLGGGPGMVMMAQPLDAALQKLVKLKTHVVYLSPQGKNLDAHLARQLASYEHLVLICGHYEGVDQRVIQKHVDEEISIGDYVLTNGCLAALVLLDATMRFVPGVLGDEQSCAQDSFEKPFLDHPHYTLPRDYQGSEVPQELLSGDHAKIDLWRQMRSAHITWQRRPDLVACWSQLEAEPARHKEGIDSHLSSVILPTNHLSWYRKTLSKHLGLLWIDKSATIGALLLERGKILLWQSSEVAAYNEVQSQQVIEIDPGEWNGLKYRAQRLKNQEGLPQITVASSWICIEEPQRWRILIHPR